MINRILGQENSQIGNIAAVGQHKVPRFLYHFTTTLSYNSIFMSQKLKPSSDYFAGDGVFMVDMPNLIKDWEGTEICKKNLLEMFLNHVSKGYTHALTVLKIPRANLDISKLFIRDQKLFFSISSQEMPQEAQNIYDELVLKKNSSTKKEESDIELQARLLWYEKFASPTYKTHMQGETPAIMSRLFKQRKAPIEYIYRDEIPFQDIQVLKISRTTKGKSPLDIIRRLLKGKPETKQLKSLEVRKS